jgi:hypothetical protein
MHSSCCMLCCCLCARLPSSLSILLLMHVAAVGYVQGCFSSLCRQGNECLPARSCMVALLHLDGLCSHGLDTICVRGTKLGSRTAHVVGMNE